MGIASAWHGRPDPHKPEQLPGNPADPAYPRDGGAGEGRAPAGRVSMMDDTVTLPRAEYEALLDRLEEAEDVEEGEG